jgi:hypothetical protein
MPEVAVQLSFLKKLVKYAAKLPCDHAKTAKLSRCPVNPGCIPCQCRVIVANKGKLVMDL